MDAVTWKEKVRLAASRAGDDRQMSRIAKDTEIRRDRLYHFVSKGYLGSNDLKALADWLLEHGYIEGEAEKEPPPAKSPDTLLAAEFRVLADLFESPDVPKEIKGERFVAAVRGWNAAIDKYAAMLKK